MIGQALKFASFTRHHDEFDDENLYTCKSIFFLFLRKKLWYAFMFVWLSFKFERNFTKVISSFLLCNNDNAAYKLYS